MSGARSLPPDARGLPLWREASLEKLLHLVCEGLRWLGGG